MPIKILLADDSDVMRQAIKRLLEEDPRIDIVGEASTFATAMQMLADLKPDVLIIDLHMPEKRDFLPSVVKSQLHCVDCTIAISFANDDDAKSLSESYGAVCLLDKMHLYTNLMPAILKCSEPRTDRPYPPVPPSKANPPLEYGD